MLAHGAADPPNVTLRDSGVMFMHTAAFFLVPCSLFLFSSNPVLLATNQLLVTNISNQAVMKLIAHGVPFFVFPISLSYA